MPISLLKQLITEGAVDMLQYFVEHSHRIWCKGRSMKRIVVDKVSFSYNEEKVVQDLSLDIESGDFICILGESGCGKSTLLKMLAGLSFPNTGSIQVEGESISGTGLDRGVVFQDYGLYPWMTTGKNIMLSLKQKYPNKGKAELKQEILHYLTQVGLEEAVYQKYPNELSGGMRQRCALCRAFALDPPILLMDEPFGALDAVTRFRLQSMVKEMWTKTKKNRKTIVFVTHDVDEALYLATKIFVLGMKPSKVIYQYELEDRESQRSRSELYQKPEYITLRKEIMDVLNKDIEERI